MAAASLYTAVVVEEEMRELNLPSGYKFCPLDTELVLHYLKRKILGQQLPADIIKTVIDLYKVNPDQLPLSEFKYGMENVWYFFTTRPKDDLSTSDGCWETISVDQKIVDGNEVIGFMQTLVFYLVNPPNRTKTNWIVHEYKVNPDIFPVSEIDDSVSEKISNFVLCKVIRAEDDPLKAIECGESSHVVSSDSSVD